MVWPTVRSVWKLRAPDSDCRGLSQRLFLVSGGWHSHRSHEGHVAVQRIPQACRGSPPTMIRSHSHEECRSSLSGLSGLLECAGLAEDGALSASAAIANLSVSGRRCRPSCKASAWPHNPLPNMSCLRLAHPLCAQASSQIPEAASCSTALTCAGEHRMICILLGLAPAAQALTLSLPVLLSGAQPVRCITCCFLAACFALTGHGLLCLPTHMSARRCLVSHLCRRRACGRLVRASRCVSSHPCW